MIKRGRNDPARVGSPIQAMEESVEDPYDVLGVPVDATAKTIKEAYVRLVREHPPERDPERYRSISAAYQTLANPEKRRAFDAQPRLSPELRRAIAALPPATTPADQLKRMLDLKERLPEEKVIDEWIAFAKLDAGRGAETLNYFRLRVAEEPGEMRHRRCFARATIAAGRKDRGFEIFAEASALKPDDPLTWFWTAEAYSSLGKVDETLETLQRGIDEPTMDGDARASLLLRRLEIACVHGRHAAAEKTIASVIDAAETGSSERRQHITRILGQLMHAAGTKNLPLQTEILVAALRRLSPDDPDFARISEEIAPSARRMRAVFALFADESVPKALRDWAALVTGSDAIPPKKRQKATQYVIDEIMRAIHVYRQRYEEAKVKHPEVLGLLQADFDALLKSIAEHRSRRMVRAVAEPKRRAAAVEMFGNRWLPFLLAAVLASFKLFYYLYNHH